MDAKELILRFLEQSQEYLSKALEGLSQEELAWSPGPECNSIAFILWHTTRVEDFFVNRVIQREKELYEAQAWQDKLGTPLKVAQYTVEELGTIERNRQPWLRQCVGWLMLQKAKLLPRRQSTATASSVSWQRPCPS